MEFVVRGLEVGKKDYKRLMFAMDRAGMKWASGHKATEYTPRWAKVVDVYLHGTEITLDDADEEDKEDADEKTVDEAVEMLRNVKPTKYSEEEIMEACARAIVNGDSMPPVLTLALSLFVQKIIEELRKGEEE